MQGPEANSVSFTPELEPGQGRYPVELAAGLVSLAKAGMYADFSFSKLES